MPVTGCAGSEAAGFNTSKKASGAVMQACLPAMEGQPSATMASISHLQLVPPHASRPIGNSDGSPFIPSNIHHKLKKTKTFGLDVSGAGQIG
ncbi:hypothetical protein HMPREF9135_2340 [Segatella baroniae F0067]|uniref:Uncharacterized protein n=1 Tax=Segatella baroniae F0067 TaxID=1115809 RepID=U2QP60_9BACT|nr:hypothetical protein HMPREF9135_2340 [Segatella baroniae F0067]